MDGAGHGPAKHVPPGLARDRGVGRDNTGTTIVTFLMVFLIQSTQNRDAEAVQVKLDEIIRAIGNAKNELLDLEELEEEDLDEIRETYRAIARKARDAHEKKDATPRRRR
jgi:low affinity Fe/Cu permease